MSCGISSRRFARASIYTSLVIFGPLLASCETYAEDPNLERSKGEPLAVGNEESSLSPPASSQEEIRELVARLDAVQFESRDEATRELLAQGAPVVPFLVAALSEESGEVRLRAGMLLKQHLTYEDVAPHLVKALDSPCGPRAHLILRHRAIQQVDDAYGLQHTAKLLKFWGTNLDGFRSRVVTQFDEASTREELEQALGPLWGFHGKTLQFNDTLARLESLSLPYDHQYSPGFVIAKTLARGLGENRQKLVGFSENYLSAFEKLVLGMQQQSAPPHAVRKEVADRANMTQGAASYLVQLLDGPQQRDAVTRQIGFELSELQEDFFVGVASPDAVTYDRGVGKVHIVDMLSELLNEPPVLPREGVVADLIDSARQTALEGNKPKALAFLDALEAFKELSKHGLDSQKGLGQRLARRLYTAALEAANNRAYHPTRIVHDKIVAFVDLEIQPGDDRFPTALLDHHLQGEGYVVSDEHRLALGRYLRIVDRLHNGDVSWERPGIRPFVMAMRDDLTGNRKLLSEGASYLDSLVKENGVQGGAINAEALSQALSEWTIEATSRK